MAINRELGLGLAGQDVKELQSILNRLGYGLKVDGIFGALTKNAVLAFQRNANIRIDGIVGKETLAALGKALTNNITVLNPANPEKDDQTGKVNWPLIGLGALVLYFIVKKK